MGQLTKEQIEDIIVKVEDLIERDDFRAAIKEINVLQKKIEDDSEFKPYLIRSHYYLSMALCGTSDFGKAREQIELAFGLTEGIKDDLILADVLRQWGHVLLRRSEYEMAKQMVEKSLDISRRIKNPSLEGLALMELANVSYLKGEPQKAINDLREAILLLGLTSDKKNIARGYNNLASFVHVQGDKEKAIEYFDKAIEIGKKSAAVRYMALAMMNKAGVLLELKRHDEALIEASEAARILQEIGNKFLLAKTYLVCGMAQAAKGDWAEAENLIHKAKFMVRSVGIPTSSGIVLLEIGKVYMLKGDRKRGLRHINEAKAIFEEYDYVVGLKKVAEYLKKLDPS